MKKVLFPILLTALLAVSAGRPAHAADPCNPEIRKIQETHANVLRIRDHAYMHQIMEYPRKDDGGKPKSVINLSCLDKALKLTAFLSNLFSGLGLNMTITPHTNVFCGILHYPTLPPTIGLSTHLKNFLGAWKPNWLNLLPAFQVRLCTPPVQFTLPHLSLGGSLGGCLPNINLGGVLPIFKPQCVSVQTPGMNCNLIKDLWKGSDTSTEGNGVIAGTPYINLQKLVHVNVPNMGDYFKHQVQNAQNAPAILQRALNNMVILKQPGGINSWPTAPTFSANSNVQDIINGM